MANTCVSHIHNMKMDNTQNLKLITNLSEQTSGANANRLYGIIESHNKQT